MNVNGLTEGVRLLPRLNEVAAQIEAANNDLEQAVAAVVEAEHNYLLLLREFRGALPGDADEFLASVFPADVWERLLERLEELDESEG